MQQQQCDAERVRLANILAMLGSAHDGEVVNAGRMADTIVKRSGLTWPQFLEPNVVVLPQEPRRELTGNVKSARALIAAYRASLRDDEVDFLLDVIFRGGNSVKVTQAIDEISASVQAREADVSQLVDEIVSAISATRSFNAKELSFLASMKALTGTPTAKQKTWLDKLTREAMGGGQ